MTHQRTLLAAVALLLSSACGSSSYSAPYMAWQPPDGTRRLGPVSGRTCSGMLFGAQFLNLSTEAALRDALAGTEATGVVDAEVTVSGEAIERCIEVSGVAVRVPPQARPR